MPLTAIQVKSGSAFTVYFLEENGECDLMEFLKGLSDCEGNRIRRYLKLTAEIGLIKNDEMSKSYGDGIHYWRTRGGVRIFYFTDAGKVVVCANGYVKKKNKLDRGQIDRCKNLRQQYLMAKARNELKFSTETI